MQEQDHREFDETRPEPPKKKLSPAACRALAEAEDRRRLATEDCLPRPKEINGRGGPDPTRYGDWEVKGIASDF
jgi:hypothetical protein